MFCPGLTLFAQTSTVDTTGIHIGLGGAYNYYTWTYTVISYTPPSQTAISDANGTSITPAIEIGYTHDMGNFLWGIKAKLNFEDFSANVQVSQEFTQTINSHVSVLMIGGVKPDNRVIFYLGGGLCRCLYVLYHSKLQHPQFAHC